MYDAGIEAFLAIVETQNLKKAGELLNLTQATISYRLKTLEQEMGAALIERGKGIHRVTLTSLGENFIPIAERWSVLNRDMEKLQAGGLQLSLSIGGSNSLNTYVLPPLYQALIQHTPKIKLTFRTQHSIELWDTIERRELDVAFVKMERTVPNIAVEPFYVDEAVLIRPSTDGIGILNPIHPSELDNAYEIYWNWGPAFQSWHDRWWDPLRSAHIPVDVAGLIFSLMQDSRQWSVVPKSVADNFVKSGNFIIQRLLDLPPKRICYKITPANRKAHAQKSLDILHKYMANIFSLPIIK